MKRKRKIVYLQVVALSDGSVLYALANDGTVWFRIGGTDKWTKVAELPQDP